MRNDEAATPAKSEKLLSPAKEQSPVYPYPDWSAMQAYYGHGVMHPPYFSTAVTPGHAPHPYMWGPQPMIPPFGTPYAAMYPHGGAYPHPNMPLMANPLSAETAAGSANNKVKKSKEVDDEKISDSDSSDVSDNRNKGISGNRTKRKRSLEEDKLLSEGKVEKKVNNTSVEASGSPKLPLRVADITVKPLAAVPSYGSPTAVNPSSISNNKGKNISSVIPPARNGETTELWIKDERELKREKRKQSNRESARRSRLRKQAETEDLAMRVESLTAENNTLRSEITRLAEDSEKLKLENSALLEKLNNAGPSQINEITPDYREEIAPSVVAENLLSKIDNPSPKPNSNPNSSASAVSNINGQLLDLGRITDAVAAN